MTNRAPSVTRRLATTAVLGAYTLLLALIALNNIIDPGTNWPFVQHVLAMDTTFESPRLMWRAITHPTLQGLAYGAIVGTQTAAAGLCAVGCVRLWRRRTAPAGDFERAKRAAILGVTVSLLLWLGGFLALGAEWFAMWQSEGWNASEPASRYLIAGGIVLLLLFQRDDRP